VKGKTIAWVPVGLGTPLTEEWTRRIKMGAEALGMKFVLRDSNWDPRREAEAVQSLINERPDVMVVHNFDVQLLAKLIQQASSRASTWSRSTWSPTTSRTRSSAPISSRSAGASPRTLPTHAAAASRPEDRHRPG